MKPKIILFSLLLLASHLSLATIHYVSKTGSSTPPYTTWATASDSIQKCINICQNGDTVYVANGVYKETLIVNKEIALIGSSMDSTVIDGKELNYYTIDILSKTHIENFSIYGKALYDGWAIRAYQLFSINSCLITDCGLGIGMVGVPCLMNNVIIRKAIRGFGGGCFSDTCNYQITNNVISLDANNSIGISTSLGGTYYIKNNIIVFNNQFSNPSEGISVGAPRKIYINNNLISGFKHNIFIDIVLDSVFIKNNLLLRKKNTNAIWDGSIYTESDDAIIKNNIFSNNANNAIFGIPQYIDLNYNIFWENCNDLYYLTYGDSDRVTDPMFVKDTVPSPQFNFDYHLQAFSPGIDKGDPNILDIDGTRSDIGLYGGPFGEIYTFQDLAPRPPRNLSALLDTFSIKIKWNKNSEADTAYYKVYRDIVQNFAIDTTKLIGTTTDTLYVHSLLPIGKYYYKVTCVDNQGNESNPSEEIVVNITSINDYPMTINDYFLYQNYPNPFNPSTTIGYKLKERGYVKLMVYDIKGELVSVLVNQEQEQGYYEVEFSAEVSNKQLAVGKGIASGIYLYRIEVIGEENIPVYMEMKKMLMIK